MPPPGRAVVLLVLAAVASLPTAGAFSIVPPGTSPHDDITDAGATEAGFPGDAVEALQQAVREPDAQDSEYDPQLDEPGRIDADNEYEAGHHCDRVPPITDVEAFDTSVAYIAWERGKAVEASSAGEVGDAIAALGRALHALQDCYSHSNIVDLGPADQAAFQQAVLAAGPAVPGLLLVSYDPGADEPGRPEGDRYGHDKFAKDSAHKNDESETELPDGRTKFEAARDLAINATTAMTRHAVRGS